MSPGLFESVFELGHNLVPIRGAYLHSDGAFLSPAETTGIGAPAFPLNSDDSRGVPSRNRRPGRRV